jgi:hypothetical protein
MIPISLPNLMRAIEKKGNLKQYYANNRIHLLEKQRNRRALAKIAKLEQNDNR